MSVILDEHRQYLADAVRLDAYDRALSRVVHPGDVVVDLACGTGILGLLACRAGAARVYAIDNGGMIDIARRLARANGVADRITHLAGHSMRVSLPEPADVVVCDQLGHFGFEAGVVQVLRDARVRWLKPDGRLMPATVALHVAGLEHAALSGDVTFWSHPSAGFDLTPAQSFAANSAYDAALGAEGLLTPGARVITYDMHEDGPDTERGEVVLVVRRPGTLHGLAGWFVAELAPGVRMTNAPDAVPRINRRNMFLPIEAPMGVISGDALRVSVLVRAPDRLVNWSVEVVRNGRVLAACAQSTMKGLLLTREEVAATRGDAVPVLDAWARARRTVLDLCDGARELHAIEAATFERHPDLFRSSAAAATFVAEVIARSARRG